MSFKPAVVLLVIFALFGAFLFLDQVGFGASAVAEGLQGLLHGPSHSRSLGPTSSGPIAITPDDEFLWVANPDNNSVSLLAVGHDANRKLAEIRVGVEPRNVAISPDGHYVYVSNAVSGTVSVIRANHGHPHVIRTVRVGTEPDGMAFTPNGSKLFVANARSNNITVIDPHGHRVIDRIPGVGLEPRGIAITDDGDGADGDEKVYVTRFLAVDRPGTLIGADDYKEGRVTVISAGTDRVIGQVVLNPMANAGFRSNGSVLSHVPATDPPTFGFVTGAFPNQLNNIAIKGDRAYLPSTGASPDGPVRFNVNVQALLSVIDLRTDAESGAQTINMNRGINFEPPGPGKVFLGVPWAIAFEHRSNVGYAIAAASNVAVKVVLDAGGTPTINAPAAAGDPGGIVRVFVGQNPRGIVISSRDDRAYVANEVSRDVSVIDLSRDRLIATIRAADLPAAGTQEATRLIGKALFNTSAGVHLPELGVELGTRLSSEGWSGCVSCHPNGLTDGVVWIFGTGPRRTLPLNGSFNPHDPQDIKILNYSGVNDEIQDFEANIRNVSGGLGLITQADGVTPDPVLNSFNPPNTGRSALLDALTLYVATAVRTPISPLASADPNGDAGREVERGRILFTQANCAACHGGGGWASSRRDYAPPPDPTEIAGGQLKRFLRQVGTFDATAPNELRANGAPAAGADGFVPPSLLGEHGLGPFLHNGSAQTLADVLENLTHRSAGTGGVDHLGDPADRARLARFLESIDASTVPLPRTGLPSAQSATTQPVAAIDREAPAGGAGLELAVVGPNPSRARFAIRFRIPRPETIELAIFDLQGRKLATLVRGFQAAGTQTISWDGTAGDGSRLSPGVYLARLRTAEGSPVVRIVRGL